MITLTVRHPADMLDAIAALDPFLTVDGSYRHEVNQTLTSADLRPSVAGSWARALHLESE